MTIVIAQVGLEPDLLPTVTAFISATPNLGGVLGVGIVGTGTHQSLHDSMIELVSRLLQSSIAFSGRS